MQLIICRLSDIFGPQQTLVLQSGGQIAFAKMKNYRASGGVCSLTRSPKIHSMNTMVRRVYFRVQKFEKELITVEVYVQNMLQLASVSVAVLK